MIVQHTRGPWNCLDDDGIYSGSGNYYIMDKGSRIIAKVPIPLHGIPCSLGEAQLNTKLIATAPELLACLEQLDFDGGLGIERHKTIRAILNKAKGAI